VLDLHLENPRTIPRTDHLCKDCTCLSCGASIDPVKDLSDGLEVRAWQRTGLCKSCQKKLKGPVINNNEDGDEQCSS